MPSLVFCVINPFKKKKNYLPQLYLTLGQIYSQVTQKNLMLQR